MNCTTSLTDMVSMLLGVRFIAHFLYSCAPAIHAARSTISGGAGGDVTTCHGRCSVVG